MYDWRRVAERTVRVYDDVMESRRDDSTVARLRRVRFAPVPPAGFTGFSPPVPAQRVIPTASLCNRVFKACCCTWSGSGTSRHQHIASMQKHDRYEWMKAPPNASSVQTFQSHLSASSGCSKVSCHFNAEIMVDCHSDADA